VIAGAVELNNAGILRTALLLFGLRVCVMLQATIERAQLKFDLTLELLGQDQSHPYTVVNDLANKNKMSQSRRNLIAVVPAACVRILTLALIYSIAHVYSVIFKLQCNIFDIAKWP
jgi:hypothetical protein